MNGSEQLKAVAFYLFYEVCHDVPAAEVPKLTESFSDGRWRAMVNHIRREYMR